MAGIGVLIAGASGTGKSDSTRGLTDTIWINAASKRLPFKHKLKTISIFKPDDLKALTDAQVLAKVKSELTSDINILNTDDPQVINVAVQYISDNFPNIKRIILDDWQYVSASSVMKKVHSKGYDKWSIFAKEIWDMAKLPEKVRDDLIIYYLTHTEEYTDSDGVRHLKAKTVGKLVDNLITLEGMFSIVVYAGVEKTKEKGIQYLFYTKSEGNDTCKTPRDMFPEEKMENNLSLIDECIRNF